MLPITFWNPHTERQTEKCMTEKYFYFSVPLYSFLPSFAPSLADLEEQDHRTLEKLHFNGHVINQTSYISLSLTSLCVINFR